MLSPRILALALSALAMPVTRAAAQTCQGTASFQDGRWRVSADDQNNSDFNDIRGTFAYGEPRSFYGGLSLDALQVGHAGPTTHGVGAKLGYQIHLSDTPFQFCPEVWAHYESEQGTSNSRYRVAFGGSLGYRIDVSDRFSVVPATGVWFITTRTSDMVVTVAQPSPGPSAAWDAADNGASNEIFMTIGLVFNRTLTVNPGILVPSRSGAKTVYTLGVSINWAK